MSTTKKGEVSQVGFVTRRYLEGGKITKESDEPVMMKVRRFETEPAKVNVSLRGVKNLGNYETFHCEVGIQLPCYAEEADAAYDYAAKWARERMIRELEEI